MSIESRDRPAKLEKLIHDEFMDSLDEELELEADDERLAALLKDVTEQRRKEIDRDIYFKELLHLQRELVRLQDWVVHNGLKLVVIFEGRDAAGKGGVIQKCTPRFSVRWHNDSCSAANVRCYSTPRRRWQGPIAAPLR